MANEQDAAAALERWREGQGYKGFMAGGYEVHEDSGFMAGYEAGHDELRDKILRLWDDMDAWIPGGADYRLAEVLGLPTERLLTYRHGGQSRPSRRADHPNHPNIPLG